MPTTYNLHGHPSPHQLGLGQNPQTFDIQQALSNLEKIFRNLPDFSNPELQA